MKKVSIVLPTYNEKANLEKFVRAVLKEQKNLPDYKLEIVISDSHSSDGTASIARRLSKRYRNIHHIDVGRGLGVGLYEGHKFAINKIKPDILMQMDADGQVSQSVIPRLTNAMDEGYDLALGSRFVKGGKNKLPIFRRIFTYGSSYVCRIIMGPLDIAEFTNSARAFTPELFRKINWKRLPWREKTFIMLPAFLNEAVIAGAKYKEVPLIFSDRPSGYSKNKVISYSYDLMSYAIDARLHKWRINIPVFNFCRKIKKPLSFLNI